MMLRRGFQEGVVQGLTVLKFMSLPGFILATIGHFIAKKWAFVKSQLKFRVLQALSLMTPMVMTLLGTRLLVLLWVVPYVYMRVGFSKHLEPGRPKVARLVKYFILLGMASVLLFSAGFYLRHYMKVATGEVASRRYIDPSELTFPKYVFLNFVSYPFRTVNNGLVIVDNVHEHTFLWRTLRWAYSGMGIEKIDPGNLIRRMQMRLMYLQWTGCGYFTATNSSLPGFMYMDLGWFALIISLLLGLVIGHLYNLWSQKCLSAWILLPIILVGLLDSWRTDMIFRSVSMVCIISAALALRYISSRFAIISKSLAEPRTPSLTDKPLRLAH
jgi:hypothetical protein